MDNFFYQDSEKKKIKESLLTKEACEWARRFVNGKLTSAQLRRFHNEAKELEYKIKSRADGDFLKYRPLVKMLKSKVAYACPDKGKKKIPKEFREYIELMAGNINDKKDFMAFALCFEAVVGYFYGIGGKK